MAAFDLFCWKTHFGGSIENSLALTASQDAGIGGTLHGTCDCQPDELPKSGRCGEGKWTPTKG